MKALTNFAFLLLTIIIVGLWWWFVSYELDHWSVLWSIVSIATASFALYISVRLIDKLRLDVSARLGKVISRQLLVKGIVVAISVAILLGIFEKVLNK